MASRKTILGILLMFAVSACSGDLKNSVGPTNAGDEIPVDDNISANGSISCLEEKLLENRTITDIADMLKKQLENLKMEKEEQKESESELKEAMAQCHINDSFDESQAVALSLCILRSLNATCDVIVPGYIYRQEETTLQEEPAE